MHLSRRCLKYWAESWASTRTLLALWTILGNFCCSVGGNQSSRSKPTLSKRVAHSITWRPASTGNRTGTSEVTGVDVSTTPLWPIKLYLIDLRLSNLYSVLWTQFSWKKAMELMRWFYVMLYFVDFIRHHLKHIFYFPGDSGTGRRKTPWLIKTERCLNLFL